jgi:hypothetical protein
MSDLGLLKPEYATIADARQLLTECAESYSDNVIAELAQRLLRRDGELEWPTPKGSDPVDRLRAFAVGLSPLAADKVDARITEAREIWEANRTQLWSLVRGKYVLDAFASRATHIKKGQALLEMVARTGADLAGFQAFRERLSAGLA